MIQAVTDAAQKQTFLQTVEGVPYFQALLGRDAALWTGNPGAPSRLFTLPGGALALSGRSAQLCCEKGTEPDWEELALFLQFAGVKRLTMNTCPPETWPLRRDLDLYTLAPGGHLEPPPLLEGLTIDRSPSMQAISEELFPGEPEQQEHFYSESCTALNHGYARVLAVRDGAGEMICTVGAYAICNGEAYMAAGETREELRGRGIGGHLIATMANELAAEGYTVTFLCEEKRRHFYDRLGFVHTLNYGQYLLPPQDNNEGTENQ